MGRKVKFLWIAVILLLPIFPLSGLLYGVDVSDVGLSINQYRFCFQDIGSVYLPILLTEVIGAIWFQILGWIGFPTYLGTEILWVLAIYYMCFLSWKIYRKYRNDDWIYPALCIAILFAKCNFHYFIYATGVAVMSMTALYFLILALNEEKCWMLGFSTFFLVLACLCKVSSVFQFAVFAVLFYDLYKKKNTRYFWRQMLSCVVGGLVGLLFAFVLIQLTCGYKEYGQMLVEMFLYAGNSQDGHTLGNMVMSNVKGAVRGLLLIGVAGICYVAAQKVKVFKEAIRYGTPVVVIGLLIGKLAGAEKLPGISAIYAVLENYINALAIMVAMIYVCMFFVLKDKEYDQKYKNLVLASGLLTVLMPLGSNTGIQHVCNEAFFVIPVMVVLVTDKIKKLETGCVGKKTKYPTAGTVLICAMALWCVGMTAYQSSYMTRAYYENKDQAKESSIEELKYMKYDAQVMDELEDITAYLREYAGGERKLIVGGAAPILNYLSGIPPYNEGCGGWIETEFITKEQISQQLEDVEVYPIVVLCKTAIEEKQPKVALVAQFVEDNDYELTYQTAEYSVYLPADGR